MRRPCLPRDVLLPALLPLALAGCVDRRPSVQAQRDGFDRAPLAAYVSTVRPASPAKAPAELQADFGGFARLVGVELDPPAPMPGTRARLTLLFEVLDEPEHDVSIFLHVDDRSGRVPRQVLDHGPVGGGYPATLWRPGEFVRDVTDFVVPPYTAPGTSFELWTGFFLGGSRVPVVNRERVRVDENGRALAGAFVSR